MQIQFRQAHALNPVFLDRGSNVIVNFTPLVDSLVANWESMDDCSGEHSSSNEDDDADADSADADEDSQFLNEEDFASAVARAAQESGLTVVGSTISEAKASKSGELHLS